MPVGSDTIGNVQVVPAGTGPEPSVPLLEVTRAWGGVRFADLLAQAGIVDPVGIPGVQDKVSARMLAVPARRAGARYILKLDPPELPYVVANEAFFLGVARRVRLEVARGEVVSDAEGRPGLLVTRFDRVGMPDGSSTSLACEDACQVDGWWPADKYLKTAEEAESGLADRCAARPVALRSLFLQACFVVDRKRRSARE